MCKGTVQMYNKSLLHVDIFNQYLNINPSYFKHGWIQIGSSDIPSRNFDVVYFPI